MKGYKVFNPDWICRDFQYAVGETFKHEGKISVCEEGFHFCQKIADCFCYYSFDSKNKVAEIEATGTVITVGDKSVTDEIKIVKELSWHEVLDMVNTGENCTGFGSTGNFNSGDYNSGHHNSGDRNSGYRNSGDRNSGDCNSGNRNSGDYNSGNRNSGYCNSGDYNSGYYNSGYRNSGDYNSGDYNSGNFNSCNYSTGFFNSVSQPLYAFNKPLSIDKDTFLQCTGMQVLVKNFHLIEWVIEGETGGYLKTLYYKTACRKMWENLDISEKKAVCEMPNFDPAVFEEITGIDVSEGGEASA
ncbi:MAG: hypothetical protein NC177_14240 [Ruminococcus flavefaciens]|nr:hypothetical protein [Ruminococcus flavefaciens]